MRYVRYCCSSWTAEVTCLSVCSIGSCTGIAKTVLTLFSTRVKMPAYANPFIELAPVLDATPPPQINNCMITTNKNTH